jgi:Asp-tRNA(Asn)/Glu-tRNA(Gln) amidotransferase A subunit family amidase
MQNLLFSFEDLSDKDKALRQIQRTFARMGANVVQTDIPTSTKRRAGISYKEVTLTFADGQTVTFCVKKTGDIFQVKINNKALPIRNQDDQKKALQEIVDAMDKGRSAFQKRQAMIKVQPPKTIRTAAPKMQEVLANRKAELQAAIEEAKAELASIRQQIVDIAAEISKYQTDTVI